MSRWSAFVWRIENHPRDLPRGNDLKMQVALSSRIFFSGFEARRASNRKEDAFGGVRCRRGCCADLVRLMVIAARQGHSTGDPRVAQVWHPGLGVAYLSN